MAVIKDRRLLQRAERSGVGRSTSRRGGRTGPPLHGRAAAPAWTRASVSAFWAVCPSAGSPLATAAAPAGPARGAGKSLYRRAHLTAPQNVLQFQSLGTLAATLPGIPALPGSPFAASFASKYPPLAQSIPGVAGMPSLPSSLPLRLPAREPRAASQPVYSPQQKSQARLGRPAGWREAFASRGTRCAECKSQKMLPQRRQWWRRVK